MPYDFKEAGFVALNFNLYKYAMWLTNAICFQFMK